jgi:hypothetical protein
VQVDLHTKIHQEFSSLDEIYMGDAYVIGIFPPQIHTLSRFHL